MTESEPPASCVEPKLNWLTPSMMEIVVEQGELLASYSSVTGDLLINNVFVIARHRRQGIGKELLRLARQEAIAIGAKAVTAAVVSRESIDIMKEVFGPEAVTVEAIGEYQQDRLPPNLRQETRAWLHYQIVSPGDQQ